ncbi:hypothetical protein HMPREF1987_01826 [Peptostreptococcaceae bacterium oral taxon 113 str. W5053]|nr:hypothetical protein HMPREF1987_01826 [Peptostreptococcaceae bacterium oral taxon 113 str. W5053]
MEKKIGGSFIFHLYNEQGEKDPLQRIRLCRNPHTGRKETAL